MNLRQLTRVRDLIKLKIHHRFGARIFQFLGCRCQVKQIAALVSHDIEYWVRNEVNPQIGFINGHGGRIHQERHVVGNDQNRRMAFGIFIVLGDFIQQNRCRFAFQTLRNSLVALFNESSPVLRLSI